MTTMPWTVANHDAFDAEYDALPETVQNELLAVLTVLAIYGLSSVALMSIRLPARDTPT